MATGNRRKSSWVLLALLFVAIAAWFAINILGGRAAAGP
jgi:hypothetical protein